MFSINKHVACYGHCLHSYSIIITLGMGAQWLSCRVLDSRPTGCGFEPHRRHCFVSLSKKINPSLILVQPRKTCPFITERLLMGRKESNLTINLTLGIYAKGYIVFVFPFIHTSITFVEFITKFVSKVCISQ